MKKNKKKHIRKVHTWLIPTKHNKHQPHILKRSSLVAIAVLLIGLQAAYNFGIAKQKKILGYATNISAQVVVSEINASRSNNSLANLTTDSQLNKAAALKADDMLKNGYWAHTAPDGSQPWRWFDVAGYKYAVAGENLAKDFKTSDGIASAWMNSESHRKNILNPNFKNVGVAVVNGELRGSETTLVVALFGAKQTPPSVSYTGQATSITNTGSSNILANPAQIQALINPVSITTLTVLLGLLVIALLTHWHYIKLPKNVRKSWYRHHAMYTALIALTAITYITYIFTSGTI